MPLALHVVTPQGSVFEGNVDSVVLPGSEGDFGVLPEHARFLSPLRVGVLEVGARQKAAVSGGFADVSAERVTVLADTCELAEQIDVERARRSKERAERRLREGGLGIDTQFDLARAELALRRALTRLSVAGQAGGP